MNDTVRSFARMVADRHRMMTPLERLQAASSLFDTARELVRAALPKGLSVEEQRLAIARRLYEAELPETALIKHARYVSPRPPPRAGGDSNSYGAGGN